MYKEILVIDDNPDIRFLICNILKEKNFAIRSAANYDQAVLEINKKSPDLAIIDIKLDKTDKDGIDLLKMVINKNRSTPVIMISGHATVQIAVEAIRLGAYEFIEKPFSTEKILNYVNRALENASLKKEKDLIEDKLFHSFDLIGKSPSIIKIKKTIEKLASSESRVLISGPTGSGKELVARKIHKNSQRSKEPFVILNAALLKEKTYEKELFGEEFGDNISFAIPTSVEIIGIFNKEHSIIACGPPSNLEETIYKSSRLYNSFKIEKSTISKYLNGIFNSFSLPIMYCLLVPASNTSMFGLFSINNLTFSINISGPFDNFGDVKSEPSVSL